MDKFIGKLIFVKKRIIFSEKLINQIFPLTREKRILLKALNEIKESVKECISLILYYEHIQKRISISKNHYKNFEIFANNCSKDYGLTKEDIHLIKNLFRINEKHKKSPLEFIKDGKIVILSENLKTDFLTIKDITDFLKISKKVFEKTTEKLQGKI